MTNPAVKMQCVECGAEVRIAEDFAPFATAQDLTDFALHWVRGKVVCRCAARPLEQVPVPHESAEKPRAVRRLSLVPNT